MSTAGTGPKNSSVDLGDVVVNVTDGRRDKGGNIRAGVPACPGITDTTHSEPAQTYESQC